jgi:hypothetical protein
MGIRELDVASVIAPLVVPPVAGLLGAGAGALAAGEGRRREGARLGLFGGATLGPLALLTGSPISGVIGSAL